MSKCDLLPDASINELGEALSTAYPHSDVIAVSPREGVHMDGWLHRLLYGEQHPRPAIDVDYEVYASGESCLGWLNATLHASAATAFDGNAVLQELAAELHRRLNAQNTEVAHMKMTLFPLERAGADLASINLVRSDFVPELGMQLSEPTRSGHIIVNLRGEGSPDVLGVVLRESVDALNGTNHQVSLRLEHVECFSPARPQPTHRVMR
jgi:hypothetical protein